ncbi:hypothetical protein GWK47_053177 [Chionoecetes opilio]|uniref:Uncharacterized protein n=1 Tax=Chionoecetes opilio TaxID=41210 RepID=A0A8J4Y5S3_CHIOP|nr:hypothetical protein GWK47_053177 [Chionoecetes opilio]
MAVRCKHHPLPLPLSNIKRLISRVCRFTWDTSLGDALRATTMGHYRSDYSPHSWIRETSRFLNAPKIVPLEHLLEDEEFPDFTCLDVVVAEKDFSHVADRVGML